MASHINRQIPNNKGQQKPTIQINEACIAHQTTLTRNNLGQRAMHPIEEKKKKIN